MKRIRNLNHLLLRVMWICGVFAGLSCGGTDDSSWLKVPEADPKERADFSAYVQDWNDAHNKKDVAAFSRMYADSLVFYGDRTSKNACIEKKLSAFRKQPDFLQRIPDAIAVQEVGTDQVRCDFSKQVSSNGEARTYAGYLIFERMGDTWRIVNEGDKTTDKNLEAKARNSVPAPPDAIRGDFNGDGYKEAAWLIEPPIESCESCDGMCECTIRFSNPSIKDLVVDPCIGGTPDNLTDLNGDGTDEIGIIPDWCTSCWHAYKVFGYIGGTWGYVIDPIDTYCQQWEDGVVAAEAHSTKPGYVITRSTDYIDFEVKTKVVKARRTFDQ